MRNTAAARAQRYIRIITYSAPLRNSTRCAILARMISIFSWNVNGIRAAEKKGLCEWIAHSGADIICLQEIKARPEQLSPELLAPRAADGSTYHAYWAPAVRPGYSGVAIYSKTEPDAVSVMGVPEFDTEGRVLDARCGSLHVISAYFPNSQEAGARLDYKLAFCRAMLTYCNEIVSQGQDVVLCGDYNIAHTPIDLANPKANEHNAGYLPEERAWMDAFTQAGYRDTFRMFCTEPGQYTWWSYRFKAREKNIGWRIDYHCVNERLAPRVSASDIRADVPGSDHCPIRLLLDAAL